MNKRKNFTNTSDGLVSVIIPSYNSGNFLNESIESVVNQTYSNLEIIIVNDGSTDNTEEIVRSWQQKDEKIRYISHKINMGPAAARNTGIKNAKGMYIAFLDADDVWLPKKIEVQLNKLKEKNADIIFSNWFIWNPEKGVKVKAYHLNPIQDEVDLFHTFVKENLGNSSTAFLKKSSLEKIGLFNENLRFSEDYDLWLRFILNNMKVVFCSEPLIYCRKHPEQSSKNIYQMRLSRLTIFKRIARRDPKFLIKYPILLRKIFLLQFYKFFIDFLNFFKKRIHD